jgi:hypothetical protein
MVNDTVSGVSRLDSTDDDPLLLELSPLLSSSQLLSRELIVLVRTCSGHSGCSLGSSRVVSGRFTLARMFSAKGIQKVQKKLFFSFRFLQVAG